MNETHQKRQPFQFTLRRLLIATAAVGLLLAIVAHRILDYRQSTRAAAEITRLGGGVSWESELLENLMEVQTIARITDVHFLNPTLDADDWQELLRIPHSFGLQINGSTFGPGEMNALVPIKRLDYLVLHNTRVDASDVVQFQQRRSDVHVMFGYPGDSNFTEFPARPH